MREEKMVGVRSTPHPGRDCYIWQHTRSPAILPPGRITRRAPNRASGAKNAPRASPPPSRAGGGHAAQPSGLFGVLAPDSIRNRVQKA
jgi:hypothetical protein